MSLKPENMTAKAYLEWLASESADYKQMMTVLFPYWMSLTPGGKNYHPEMVYSELEEQVDRWDKALEELYAMANKLSINIVGTTYRKDLPYDLEDEANWVKFTMSGEMRDMRNHWKKIMKRLGWDCSDPTWRSSDRNLVTMPTEWERFREVYESGIEE